MDPSGRVFSIHTSETAVQLEWMTESERLGSVRVAVIKGHLGKDWCEGQREAW